MNEYLIFGYIVLWIIIFVYMISLGYKIREIRSKISQLEQSLKREK